MQKGRLKTPAFGHLEDAAKCEETPGTTKLNVRKKALGKSMATFILMLKKDATPALAEKMLLLLEDSFPQHDFIAGDPDLEGYENYILATHGGLGAGDPSAPSKAEVQKVLDVYRQILKDVQDWKPS